VQAGELERRSRHLEALDDASFLGHLGAWLAFADQDPASSRVLAELRAEYMRMLDRHQSDDEDALLDLVDIREQLAALTGIELEPQPQPPVPAAEGTSRAHPLIDPLRRELRLLRAAAAAEGKAAQFTELTRRFDDVAQTHDRRHRDFIALLHTSASGSLRRLDWLAGEIACDPLSDPFARCLAGGAPGAALMAAMACVRPLLQAALSDQADLTPSERRQVGHIVAGARIDAVRVHERVLRRARTDTSAHRHVRAGIGVPVHRARGGCA
jgi:hypothetical protein